MTKMTNGLASVALVAGLALGTAGAAAAATGTDNDMVPVPTGVGTTELNTPFANLTSDELSELRGQDVYGIEGTRIGRIQRVVRDVNNHQYYYVLTPSGFVGDGDDLSVIPVKQLKWRDGKIVVKYASVISS